MQKNCITPLLWAEKSPHATFKKTPIIMKSLFFACLIGSAGLVQATNTYAQTTTVSLHVENQTVGDVLQQIESKTEFSFFYNNRHVDLNRRVSVSMNETNIFKILDAVFDGTDVVYQVVDNRIVLSKRNETLPLVQQSGKKITGTVLDATGMPVIGANVMVKGTTNGTITDMDGKFSLEVDNNATLVVSYIGFANQEIKVGNQTNLSIAMKEDAEALDELVVVGYGTNTKRSLISSVSTVETKELENLPIVNITQGLAGRSPGLIVKASGGGINKNSEISIRGGATPLVVIDGVIRDYSDFTSLSPDDIENMTVLKDASATATYGSRAGNGILQITTKAGKIGKASINYSFNQSFSQPNIWPDKLNSYERAYYSNIANINDGKDPYYTEEQLQKYKDHSDPWNYPDTDWRKLVLKNFAPTQKHNISMSGGTETNQYYISLGYLDQNSLYRTNTHNMQRTNFRVSQTSLIKQLGLKTTALLDGYVQKQIQPVSSSAPYNRDDPYYYVFSHLANNGPMGLGINKYGLILDSVDNPVAETSEDAGSGKYNQYVVNAKLQFDWALPWVEGLNLKAAGNYRYYLNDEKIWQKDPDRYALDEAEVPSAAPAAKLALNKENGYAYTMQFFANYSKQIKEHYLNILAGYELSYAFAGNLSGSREEYEFDIPQLNSGPSNTSKNRGTEWESGRAGFIAQAKYNYANRYFAEASMRYDGSDNFPANHRWGAFYSASLGWSIADEAFFEPLRERNIFNTLKLRGSFGQVGLDNWGNSGDTYHIERFEYLPSYGYNNRQYVIGGIMKSGFYEGGIPSPDITWFTTTQVDVGFDFSSLNSRLYGSLDYFYYQTKGFLYAPDAIDVGYTAPLGMSLPKIKTDTEHRRAGWEFQLGYRDHIGELEYDVSANFTYFDQLWASNASEGLADKKNPYKRTTQQTGYYGTGYVCEGFYEGNEDVYNSVQRIGSYDLVSGDLKYQDFNGDGVIDGQDQIRIGKNNFPRGTYGINLGLRYKGFSLGVLLQGCTRFDTYAGSTIMMADAQSGTSPVYDFQKDYWTMENRDAIFPRLTSSLDINGSNNSVTSDFWLINGRYFRLKDVRLGYDFKKKLLKKVDWLTRLELTVSGQNLLTVSPATEYGMDPENASNQNYSYPMERTFAFGVNVGF